MRFRKTDDGLGDTCGSLQSNSSQTSGPGFLQINDSASFQHHRSEGQFFLFKVILKKRRRQWHPTPVLLPGKSHGQRSLVGCSPWGRKELDTIERLHFHFHALEKEMATHSSVLAWRIPETAEPGGLPSLGSHRVGHD